MTVFCTLKYLFSAGLFVLAPAIQAQGCSDGGFCTMGAMRPDQNYAQTRQIKLRSIELNYYRGESTVSAIISAVTLDANIRLNEKNALQVKVPYQWVNGNFGTNSGIGDISLSYTRNLTTFNDWQLNGTLGTKIPTSLSNAKANSTFTNNQPADFPMYYQVSLGTFDAIAGASLLNEDWLFATGVQIALTKNQNEFQYADWSGYPSESYLQSNDVGQQQQRGIDVMLRLERNFRFTNYNVSLGLLPIYRLTPDRGIAEGGTEIQDLPNTTGLAMSGLLSLGYRFDVNNSLKLIQGIKFTDRKKNPDGLTRNAVTSISYVYQF